MSTVGEQLRQAREAKNLTVYQVAEITKIRTDHLRALDEGNYDVFSAPVYIRGFVRTYATVIKLDVPKIMEALGQELAKSARHHEPPPLGKQSRSILDIVMFQLSRVNWRIMLPVLGIALLLFCGLFAYKIWNKQKTKDPLAGIGPGIYQPAKKNSGETLPLPARH